MNGRFPSLSSHSLDVDDFIELVQTDRGIFISISSCNHEIKLLILKRQQGCANPTCTHSCGKNRRSRLKQEVAVSPSCKEGLYFHCTNYSVVNWKLLKTTWDLQKWEANCYIMTFFLNRNVFLFCFPWFFVVVYSTFCCFSLQLTVLIPLILSGLYEYIIFFTLDII